MCTYSAVFECEVVDVGRPAVPHHVRVLIGAGNVLKAAIGWLPEPLKDPPLRGVGDLLIEWGFCHGGCGRRLRRLIGRCVDGTAYIGLQFAAQGAGATEDRPLVAHEPRIGVQFRCDVGEVVMVVGTFTVGGVTLVCVTNWGLPSTNSPLTKPVLGHQ